MSEGFHAITTQLVLPPRLAEAISDFMRDGLTGNIQINIRDGKILGYHAEEIVSIKG